MDQTDSVKSQIPTETEFALIAPLSCRDITLDQDSRINNAYIHPEKNGKRYLVKRPGVEDGGVFNGGGVGVGQGVWDYNGYIVYMNNGVMTRYVSPTSAGFTNGVTWNNTFNATWQGRAQFACVVFQNKIWVIGGSTTGLNFFRDVWSSEDGENWTQVLAAAPWGARALLEACVFNGRLYVMGGSSAPGAFLNDVWVTDDGVNWTQVTASAGWSPRTGFQVNAFKNGMMLTGGSVGGGEVWFTTDGGLWSQVTLTGATWAARSQHRCVVWNDTLVLMGGSAGGNEVWNTIDGSAWNLLNAAAWATARIGFGAVVYNANIYILGGFNAGFITSVYRSNNGGATWFLVTAAYGGTGIFQGGMVVFKSPPGISITEAPSMYFMGGVDATPTYQNKIWWGDINGVLTVSYTTPFAAGSPPVSTCTSNNNQYFVLKNTTTLGIWYANEVKQIQDTNYPDQTVPGIANLDETLYVLTPDGLICGSAIGQPFVWPSLNFIGADFAPDGGVAICKYSNYVLAFGPKTFQLFYNSGAPYGTLLRPMKNANSNVGCYAPYSVVEMENTVVWVGRTQAQGAHVYRMNGLTAEVISTPAVDTLLDAQFLPPITAYYLSFNGHPWYVLEFDGTMTLVYDFAMDLWLTFDRGTLGSFGFMGAATDGNLTYLATTNEKRAYLCYVIYTGDAGLPIDAYARTEKKRHGTSRTKQANKLTITGDRIPNCDTRIRFSDDDYQTWSNYRTIATNQSRQQDTRWGSFAERAWEIGCFNATTTWRIELVSLELRLGDA